MVSDESLFREERQRRRSHKILSKIRHDLQSFGGVEVLEDMRMARELTSAWEAVSESSVGSGTGSGLQTPGIEVVVVESVGELMVQLDSFLEWGVIDPVIFVPGGGYPCGVVALWGEPPMRFIDWAARWMEAGGLLFSRSSSVLILIDWLEDDGVYEMQAAQIRM